MCIAIMLGVRWAVRQLPIDKTPPHSLLPVVTTERFVLATCAMGSSCVRVAVFILIALFDGRVFFFSLTANALSFLLGEAFGGAPTTRPGERGECRHI